ncbi:GerAB/ArcD/ProY family transporter [Paenibacillus allorhizosphaerae]|uniref:Uncharacterized protein n=1 Tax=Paenibacillus allorhizosphaerae TaxID=2849866 RepID=A0ABM8VN86_9BACL|nr:GerAB/ArcD/ProY family transporter [Paenibacillus allorhizosphaerae]CAG7651058.1 hypothetical protein PAECIP111802_04876 [Paenibacillus allorhizosphaerae]
MSAILLFEKESAFDGKYIFLIVNRLQMLYFVLLMPQYLVHPYMVWAIVAVGLASALNLALLAKWFASPYAAKGYPGFVELFGEQKLRLFCFLGMLFIFIKITVITLGYTEIVHQFVLPSIQKEWLLAFIFAVGCYLAVKGMEKAIRFIFIAYLCSFWLILLYIPFFFPPIALIHDLYPIIPTEWGTEQWQGILLIWASLSGPEYLVCFGAWFSHRDKLLRSMAIGNGLTIVEYLALFVASSLYFGPEYLKKSSYPVINMVRYLQSPIFERVDILMICIHIFHYVFAISLFILLFYGSLRVIAGKVKKPTTRAGFSASCMVLLLCLIVVYHWFWKSGTQGYFWPVLQASFAAVSFLAVPAFFVAAVRVKGRA